MDREQVGGDHYRSPKGIPEHWDIAWALNWDFYQYQITKYLWRWKEKGGIQDLRKAMHFLKKYIEVVEVEQVKRTFGRGLESYNFPGIGRPDPAEPQPHGYVDQDGPPSGPECPTATDTPAVESASPGLYLVTKCPYCATILEAKPV